jgi:hypothetical protein
VFVVTTCTAVVMDSNVSREAAVCSKSDEFEANNVDILDEIYRLYAGSK